MDINKLKLSQQSGVPGDSSKPRSLPLTFHFSKGPPATLTIVQPKAKASGDTSTKDDKDLASIDGGGPSEMNDENAKKFMELFMGMKILLAVEMNGTIVSTNATHRDGNRLTLVNFDLAQLGNSLPELEKLLLLKNSPFEESKELLTGIPGITFDLNEKVTVVFKK
jgi:hypothetical protein